MAWLEKLALHSPVAIYRTDKEGQCTYVNERWGELTGRAVEEGMGTGWRSAIHPEDVEWLDLRWSEAVRTKQKFRELYRYLRPDGRIVWVHSETVEERDGKGRLIGYIGMITDVTELQDVREALQRTRGELEQRVRERTQQVRDMAMAVEQSDDGIIRTDKPGNILGWNRAAERLFGYTVAEAIGMPVWVLVPPEELGRAREIRRLILDGESIQNEEVVRLHKNGTRFELSLSIFPLRTEKGRIAGMCSITRDLRPMKEAARRLRQLSQHLLIAQDQERRRIARELHDSTAQLLVALSINLGRLRSNDVVLDEAMRERLVAESCNLAERAVLEVRTQSYLLHPPLLDERGLLAALRFFAEGFTNRSAIALELVTPRRIERLDPAVELALFRIVQEALTNVHRHSGSAAAEITLSVGRRWIELSIRDFGKGILSQTEGMGVGIPGMRERVTQLGGKLTLRNAAPGTMVAVRLPKDPPHEYKNPAGR